MKFKTFILRNIQLQKAYTKKYDRSLTGKKIHVIRDLQTIATLDYGQRWQVLNPFPNNKHQVIKSRNLHKLNDLKFK